MRRSTAAIAALASLLMSACAVDPIDGYVWEQGAHVKRAVIKVTEVADVGPYCAQYFPGRTTLACSVQHADYCEIFVPPKSPGYIAHEAAHCLGYMHPNEADISVWGRAKRYAKDEHAVGAAEEKVRP
jgi:hypothetical protein